MARKLSLRSKIFLGTLLACTAPVAIALVLQDLLASRLIAWTAAFATALLCAVLLTTWMLRPLHRAVEWVSQSLGVDVEVGNEWRSLVSGITSVFHNLRRRLYSAETELEQRRTILSTMVDGVIVVDEQGTIRLLNPSAGSMFGVSPEQARRQSLIEVTMNEALDAAVREALATGGVASVDIDVLHPEPRRVRALISVARGTGAGPDAVAVLHDLTATLRLDQVRRDFVANVSHELRTPVTGIQMMAENLLHGAIHDPDLSRSFLDNIHSSAQRLVALVDDLLALARAEAGVRARNTPVKVAPVVRTVVADLHTRFVDKGLDVEIDVPEDLGVLADAESLRHILSNLLENAVKYTPEGSVEITGRQQNNEVDVSVRDTGIGIPREDTWRIFERFYRVDRSRTGDAGGTGLGLSIVKHLVEDLGGTVSVKSELGRGSVFTVCLPATPAPEGQGPA